MRVTIGILTGIVVLGLVAGGVRMAQAQSRSRINVDRDGVAIEGYDPVAYFTRNEAVRGNSDIAAIHDGATYYFASEQHRLMFLEDPAQYLPEYGGWCAYAMADGSFADIQPDQFVVHEGRLFLNFNGRINRRFSRDIDGYVESADRQWPQAQAQLR